MKVGVWWERESNQMSRAGARSSWRDGHKRGLLLLFAVCSLA